MKGFQYSMEQILDYRKGIENREQQEFMEKREEYEKQRNILNDYEKRLIGCFFPNCHQGKACQRTQKPVSLYSPSSKKDGDTK